MGIAAAGAVIVAAAAAITLVPALLAAAGPRIIKGKAAQRQIARSTAADYRSLGQRWVRIVTRRALPVLVAGIALLAVLALPARHIHLGLPDAGTYPATSTDRRAYDLVSQGFGPGFNSPLLVVVDTPKAASAQAVAQALAQGAKGIPDILLVTPPVQNPAHTLTLVTVIPKTGPNDPATQALVSTIRAKAASATRSTGVQVLVTGTTALNLDVSSKLSAATVPYLVTVAIICILLLMLVFRSILVPIKAVIGYLFSVVAALGVTTWIFQQGHLTSLLGIAATGPIVSFVPLILAGVLFGLAMDYEVFLVSRIREEHTHGADPVRRDRRWLHQECPGRRRRRRDHDLRLRELHLGPRRHHQDHRLRSGARRRHRRLHRPYDPGAGGARPPRPFRMVAAGWDRPRPPRHGHRRRAPRHVTLANPRGPDGHGDLRSETPRVPLFGTPAVQT